MWCLSHEDINVVKVRNSRDPPPHSVLDGIELLSKSNHLQLETFNSFCVSSFYPLLSYLGRIGSMIYTTTLEGGLFMLEQQLIQSPRNASLPAKICNLFPSTNFEVIKVEPRRRLTSSDLCQFDPCYVKVRITRGLEAKKKEKSIGKKQKGGRVGWQRIGLHRTTLLFLS